MLKPISKDDQAQIANKSLSGRKPGQTEGGWAANQGSMLGLYGAGVQTTQRHRTTR